MTQPNLKYDHVYVIIRFDTYGDELPIDPQSSYTIKKIVWSEEEAEKEVERLNNLNAEKGATYFYQLGRLEKQLSTAN